ncbi:MAG: hypothetical protein AB7Q45_16715, partial [Planctomycetaceae bacterium]
WGLSDGDTAWWCYDALVRLPEVDRRWCDFLALTSGLHPSDRDELWPLFDTAGRNSPHWLVQYHWDIASRFTHAAFTAHGVGIQRDSFQYAGGPKRKVDCDAVYKLLDEGLWWPILAGKRLATVSGQAEALAARLMDADFVRATGCGDVSWSVAKTLTCPPVHESKRLHWPRLRDELFAAEWDLLLCSAGSLSAILCDHARRIGRKAIDIGSLDTRFLSG